MKPRIKNIVVVILAAAFVIGGVATAAYLDPNRPPDPPNRPSILAPYQNPSVRIVCEPGCGVHSDDRHPTIKTYYATDFALVGADGWYQSFPVYASAGGTVQIFSAQAPMLGRVHPGCPQDADNNPENGIQGQGVFINHGNGWQTFYWHLSDISVSNNQPVDAGDPIGTAGCTGANSIHLHYDLRWRDINSGFTWTYQPEFSPAPVGIPVDIAFAIDTTGSMVDDIQAAKDAAIDIVNLIKDQSPNSKIAMVDFRDFPSRNSYQHRLSI